MQINLKVLGIILIIHNVLSFSLYESSGESIWIDNEKEDPIFNMPTLLETSCSWTSDCDLTCWNINGSRAEQAIINSINDDTNDCDRIRTLNVTQSDFASYNLHSNWLSEVTTVEIDHLSIFGSDLKYIDHGAFKSPAFKYTQQITLENLNIDHLPHDSFENLPSLNRVTISNLPNLTIIRESIFEPINETVTRIEIRNLPEGFWICRGLSFIETIGLPVLRELVMINNHFSNKLTENVFKQMPSLITLRMSFSGITSLPVDVFKNLPPSLNTLRLDGNLLQTVPEGVFDEVIARNGSIRIYLSGNLWHCHCENLHLQELIRNNMEKFPTVVECSFNGEAIKHKIVDVEIDCSTTGTTEITTQTEEITTEEISTEEKTNNQTETDPQTDEPTTTAYSITVTSTTTTQSPTTTAKMPDSSISETSSSNPSSTTTSEPINSSYSIDSTTLTSKESQTTQPTSTTYYPSPIVIDCSSRSFTYNFQFEEVDPARGGGSGPSTVPTAPTIPYRPSQITLDRAMIDFSIKTVALNKVELKFDVSNFSPSMAVLYYDSSLDHLEYANMLQKTIKCADVSNSRETYITDLTPGVTYTICYSCITNNIFIFNTPFNCKTHYMPLARGEQPWLYQNQKILIISVVFLIVLITLLAGVIATYFMIRRMPTLLRGSKRVVMVNNRAKDVMVMPPEKAKPNTYQRDFPVYYKDEQQANYMTPVARHPMQRPSLHRSCSDTSLNSARSYMTVSPPRFSNVFQQAEFCCDVAKRSGSYPCAVPPAIPPPLPPYPPNHRRSIASNASTAEINKVSRNRSVYDDRRRTNGANCGNKHQQNVYEDATENHYNFII